MSSLLESQVGPCGEGSRWVV